MLDILLYVQYIIIIINIQGSRMFWRRIYNTKDQNALTVAPFTRLFQLSQYLQQFHYMHSHSCSNCANICSSSIANIPKAVPTVRIFTSYPRQSLPRLFQLCQYLHHIKGNHSQGCSNCANIYNGNHFHNFVAIVPTQIFSHFLIYPRSIDNCGKKKH